MNQILKYTYRILPPLAGLATIAWWLIRNWERFQGSSSAVLLLWGRLCGILLALAMLYMLLQLGKNRPMEKAIAKPKLFKIHKFVGIFIILPLLVLHFVFVIAGRAAMYSESFGMAIWRFVKFLPWGTITTAGAVLLLIILIFCYFFVGKKISFNSWKISHYFVYLALILTLFHQFEFGNDFVTSRPFWIFWLVINLLVWLDVAYSKGKGLIHK